MCLMLKNIENCDNLELNNAVLVFEEWRQSTLKESATFQLLNAFFKGMFILFFNIEISNF